MFSTDLYMDRILPERQLADAVGPAFGVAAEQVAVIPNELVQQIADAWRSTTIRILLRASTQDGSFPLVLGLLLRESRPVDFVGRLERVAENLGASLLTDEAHVHSHSDSEYLLIGADGRSEVVYLDTANWDSDSPTFELLPASQLVHQAHSVSQVQHAG